MKKFDQVLLEALRRSVPHATTADFIIGKEGASAEMLEDLDKYFRSFAKPAEGHPCLRCGNPLSPRLVDALLGAEGGFEWGLVHGHGHCRKCRWPAVAHHFIKDRDGKDICTIRNLILQLHPDDMEIRNPEKEEP